MLKFIVSIDRKGRGRRILERNGLKSHSFEFIGVDGRRLSALDYFRVGVSGRSKPMTPSEVGCALAHMEAYERLLASSEKAALVLEDDVTLLGPPEDCEAVVRDFGDYPLLLHLGGQQGLEGRGRLRGEPHPGWASTWRLDAETTRWLWRTCGYVVNRPMAQLILDRQSRRLQNADSWREFIHGSDAVILYHPIVEHPFDLSDSSIEAERRLILSRERLQILLSKIHGLFVLAGLVLRGGQRIHRS